MKNCRKLQCLLLTLAFAATSASAQTNVIISEFMAANTKTLADEDGEYSDWIEIENTGLATVNLLNWALTDAAGDLTKWRFPATNLGPGQIIVVFASTKNRRTPGAPLHTNFRLSNGGEYLALVQPDGTNIATEFSPVFPPQLADISYGFGLATTNEIVINTNTSPVRVRIPANSNDGTNWTTVGFNDSAWIAGTNGVGFGSTNVVQADYGATVLPTQPVGYWRFSESAGTTAVNSGSGAGLNGSYNGATVGTAGPRPPALGGFEPNNNAPTFNGSSASVGVPNSLMSGRSAFSMAGWIRSAATQAARAGLFGQNDAMEFGFSAANNMQIWTPGGGQANLAWTLPDNQWYHITVVGDGQTLRIFTNGVLAATGSSATANYGSSASTFNIGGGGVFDATGNYFNGQIDEVAVYHRALSTNEIASLYRAGIIPSGVSVVPFVKTDVSPVMSNINATAYLRLPFVVGDPTNVALLSLRLRYNDGFVSYLNGVEVARANAPAVPDFNSAATASHAVSAMDEFRFGGDGILVPGTNILAIQGLNQAVTNADFLVQAELTVSSVAASSPMPVYFTVPSPGQPNSSGVTALGPAILEASHSPNVPLDFQDVVVTAKIVPTFFAVSNVILRYRIMFDPEIQTPMFDDGFHGDGLAGDGIYGAIIPESASTNGQMIRWSISASDFNTNVSRWPLFSAPAGFAEYLGTIVNPTNLTSKLPIIHFFAPSTVLGSGPTTTQTGADSQAGAPISIFYDGEFYDNVSMNLRGNTTAGFNKKSHHVNFNREHLFRHSGPGGRIRHTSFMSDYIDPSYMRQGLSFWLAGQIGVPEPFYNPVRLQLNGQFYQLANHNDVVGSEQIGRFGYDPNGALYKATGVTAPSQFSTGNFEKKTRTLEPNTDYQALASSINETNALGQRRTNVFDLLDLPEVISYMVAARWVHENDDVWANLTLYRDTDGDGLWRIIPFDMNLSWGAIYYEGSTPSVIEGVQATNDIHKAFPMYGSSQALALSGPGAPNNFNRMYDVIFSVPETRQMFLRRLRTVLDTYIKPPGTPGYSTELEQMILARRDLIADEAAHDRAKWGWQAKGGQNNFDPGIDLTNGVKGLIEQFIWNRRSHFYGKHSVTNTALAIGITKDSNAGIPLAQRPDVSLAIQFIEYNPSSGKQSEEYICITNTSPFALDISDWKLGGGVDFTFQKGTVITSNGVIYVSPDVKAFRARTTGPRGGQGIFVVGPYRGQLSARGETLAIHDNYGRLITTNSYVGTPSLAQQFLRVTEVMYHPASPTSGSFAADDFEYLELKNISPTVTLDLTGLRFVNGVDYTFAGGTLAPGQRVLVVANTAAFASRYGAGLNVAGQYAGLLDNAGERIQLVDAAGEEILDFTYNDTWYPVTDGLGSSLVTLNEMAEPDLWSSKSNWQAGSTANGTPGAAEPAPSLFVPVIINEVLSRSDVPPPTDSIELYNPTATNASIGGWYLTDDLNTPKKFRIPDNTTLAGGGYRVFTEADFNPFPGEPPNFGLSSDGDEVYLFSATPAGDLTGYVHGFSFGAADNGVSFGRYVTSDSNEVFVSQSALSPGATNSGPRVGPLVISEIMFHPPDVAGADNSLDEYVEVFNSSGSAVLLYDPSVPTNTWKITGGIDYAFPTNGSIAQDEYILLVNFDPTNSVMLSAFQAKYAVSPSLKVFGPYSGKLNNDGDNVELKRPTTPTNGVPYVLIDKVNFSDTAPWPVGADGFGLSLQRINLAAYGNDPVNWVAAPPTAAAPTATGGLTPVIVVPPAAQDVLFDGSVTFAVTATGSELRRYQWLFNGQILPGATNASLQLNAVQATDVGAYSVLAYNSYGSALSAPAFLTVLSPALIVTQPKSVFVAGSTNLINYGDTTNAVATFSVSAYSPTTLSYEWRFNGVAIPGATGSSLSVSNVTVANQGSYDVVVSDANGSIVSSSAVLGVLMRPVIVVSPLPQTVPLGGSFGVSVSIRGSPPPFMYSWRRGSTVMRVAVTDSTNNVLTYGPVTTTDTATWRIVVTNAALPAPAVNDTRTFAVSVQPDFDQDGLLDSWEVANGYSTNDSSNASLDLDGDGMTLLQEYIAGTDATNALSYLKIELPQVSGAATMEFQAVSNRTYTVEFTDQLGSAWQRLADFVALGTDRLEKAVDPQSNPKRFYRLRTPARP